MKILAAFVLICALPTPNLCVPAIQNGTDIFGDQVYMEDVGASEVDTDREDPQRMTNINHCLDGYNIFYGNPAPINEQMDPGYEHQIFKAEFEKQRVTGDQRWLQPDGVEIRDCSGSCRIDFKTTEISGAKSYQKSLSNKVSAKAGGSFAGFGASFSASTDFTDTQEKTSKEEKIITQSTATCCSYKARISRYSPPQLTDDFQKAVERLPQTFNDEYFRFIDYFGTHYIDEAEFGALYGVQEEITRNDWTTMKEKGLSIAVGASVEAYGASVSSEYKNEKKTKDSEEFKKHASNKRTFSIGEIPPRSGDVMDWVQKAKSSPAPMRLELGLISKILANPAIKFRKPVSSAIKENLEKALKEYCTKWLIKTARLKYPNFSCSEPEDRGFPVVSAGNYHKREDYSVCSEASAISSEEECKKAADELNLDWGNSWEGKYDFPGCLFANDGRDKVYFNTSPHPQKQANNPKYEAICKGPSNGGEQTPNFTPPMAGCLWKHNDKTYSQVPSITKCQKKCDAKSWCRSLDYIPVKEMCYLSKDTKVSAPTDWYETCKNFWNPNYYLSSQYSAKI